MSGNKVPYDMHLNIQTCRSCVCDAATSNWHMTVHVSCLAGRICRWQLPIRAFQRTCGDARAKLQGNLHNFLSANWTGMAKALRRQSGVAKHGRS
eukprot:1832739-Pyramimonas_sp.AAC.1